MALHGSDDITGLDAGVRIGERTAGQHFRYLYAVSFILRVCNDADMAKLM